MFDDLSFFLIKEEEMLISQGKLAIKDLAREKHILLLPRSHNQDVENVRSKVV